MSSILNMCQVAREAPDMTHVVLAFILQGRNLRMKKLRPRGQVTSRRPHSIKQQFRS